MSFTFSFVLASTLAHAQEPPKAEDPAVQAPSEPIPPNATPPASPTPPNTPPEAPPAIPAPPTNPPPPPYTTPSPAPAPIVVTPPAIPAPVVTPPKPKFPTRSLRIGPSLQVQLYEAFPYEKLSRVGTGMFGAYEFYLKPSFAIGINLSYRIHPGQADLHQVGYGLLLKHYLAGTSSPDSTFMPFVEYGLLLQMNFLSNRQGFGTAHDTRLSAGTDIRIAGKIFYVEGSWHYSRLGLFDQPSERLDDLEFDFGYRYPW